MTGNARPKVGAGSVQDVIEALFGADFEIRIVPGTAENRRLLSAPRIDENASSNARNIRQTGTLQARLHAVKNGRAERAL
jgi:hypothetical protein